MKKIMLLEDDVILNEGICMAMGQENYQLVSCFTIAEAKKQMANSFDLLILDVNLPDGNGFELCREVRKYSKVPIILLTARDLEIDIVSGLEWGADDYIVKPFSLMVLRARIRALLRRTKTGQGMDEYNIPPFYFNFKTMKFAKNGTLFELSKTEQRLLYYFVINPNIILSRERIIEQVWLESAEYVEDNALSVNIKRLREKLEDDPARPQYIKTVYGLGYEWVNHI